jgi:hypothetical protein
MPKPKLDKLKLEKLKSYDPRPSKAEPEARAARKRLEKENPHFDMVQNFAIKAAAIGALTALALFPWEKQVEKHERRSHPERIRERDDDGGRGKERRGRDERAGDSEDGHEDHRDRRARGRGGEERRRRQSEGGEHEREYRMFLDRDREYRRLPVDVEGASPSSVGGASELYTGTDDGEYGRRYVEASRHERDLREKASGQDGRRRRGSVDYEYRRSTRY